jgi:D-3-phosphoglycerate dehydrogenase
MHLCRNSRGGLALIVLTVDSRLPPDILPEITEAIGAVTGQTVDLDDEDA